MDFYWINKCVENKYRCPTCQNMVGTSDGSLPRQSKNHRVQTFDGQVKCAVCNTPVGYFPQGNWIGESKIRQGFTKKILDSIEYVTYLEQKEF